MNTNAVPVSDHGNSMGKRLITPYDCARYAMLHNPSTPVFLLCQYPYVYLQGNVAYNLHSIKSFKLRDGGARNFRRSEQQTNPNKNRKFR